MHYLPTLLPIVSVGALFTLGIAFAALAGILA
jgi:hypothetical protein